MSAESCSLVPPVRFGHVNTGLYRGGYPTLRNFRFLNHLQLKVFFCAGSLTHIPIGIEHTCTWFLQTVLCLIPEAPTADLATFADITGISIIHVPINRTTNINSSGFIPALLKALTVRSQLCSFSSLAQWCWRQYLPVAFVKQGQLSYLCTLSGWAPHNGTPGTVAAQAGTPVCQLCNGWVLEVRRRNISIIFLLVFVRAHYHWKRYFCL